MADLEQRMQAIEARNMRVEADKAWETSWARRGTISVITYAFAFMLLNLMENESAWKHALVPVMGYLISTLSLPFMRKIWAAGRSRG